MDDHHGTQNGKPSNLMGQRLATSQRYTIFFPEGKASKIITTIYPPVMNHGLRQWDKIGIWMDYSDYGLIPSGSQTWLAGKSPLIGGMLPAADLLDPSSHKQKSMSRCMALFTTAWVPGSCTHIICIHIYTSLYVHIYIYISLSLFCHLSRLHTFRYEPGKLCWIHKPEMKLFWISFRFLAHDKLCDLLYPFYQPISNFCHFIQYLLFPSQFVWE